MRLVSARTLLDATPLRLRLVAEREAAARRLGCAESWVTRRMASDAGVSHASMRQLLMAGTATVQAGRAFRVLRELGIDPTEVYPDVRLTSTSRVCSRCGFELERPATLCGFCIEELDGRRDSCLEALAA